MVAMIAVIAPVTGTTSARALAQSPGEHQSQAPWRAVEQVFGRTGTQLPGGVFRVAFPRDDLDVRVGSVRVEPSFALGSYAAFLRMASGTDTVMMMGDLALRDEEVPTVMTRLFERGIVVPPSTTTSTR
jgi:hypothetical protein